MGTWSTKLYGNDTTSDVRDTYIEFLRKTDAWYRKRCVYRICKLYRGNRYHYGNRTTAYALPVCTEGLCRKLKLFRN